MDLRFSKPIEHFRNFLKVVFDDEDLAAGGRHLARLTAGKALKIDGEFQRLIADGAAIDELLATTGITTSEEATFARTLCVKMLLTLCGSFRSRVLLKVADFPCLWIRFSERARNVECAHRRRLADYVLSTDVGRHDPTT